MNKQTIITCLRGFAIPVLALVAVAGQAQTFTPVVNDTIDFVIEGTVCEGADTVYLDERPYREAEEYPVRDGRFRIMTRQPLYKFLQIEDGKDGWMQLIVDSVPTHVVVDFRTNTVVEGSPLNRRFNHYKLVEDSLEREMELHEKDEDRTISESLEQQGREVIWKAIVENFDNVIPVYYLSINGQAATLSPERLAECMKEEYAFARHPEMKMVWKFYWAMQKRLPGQDYHDLALPDTAGTVHRLSDYVGHHRYVLLDFWASWCGPCIGSMPMMKEIYHAYADRGLQIIGLSLDSNRDAWRAAIRRLELPWLQLSDLKRWESVASDIYGVRAIPEIVLIAPDGKIVATGLRDEELKAKLAETFGE